MTKLFQISLVSLIVCGCATTANYDKILDTWAGAHMDKLFSSWGPPFRRSKLSDGGQIITYVQEEDVQTGGYSYVESVTSAGPTTHSGIRTTEVQRQAPVRNVTLLCTTNFTVNASGIVTNSSWEGNNCKTNPSR